MGFVIFSLVLTACDGVNVRATSQSRTENELEVRQAFLGLVDASKALNPERYFNYFNTDLFSGLNSDGTTWNSFDEFKKQLEPGFSVSIKNQKLTFTNIHITVVDERTAILVNEYEHSILLSSGESIFEAGGGTQVWLKTNGEWLLVSVSASTKAEHQKNE